ncbi:MAG: nucleotide pyrophosphatase [Candidatus Abyssobacteria bacterium SURF_5]|uniref:Nucleotide pyrophosphatase n=1 Tax=Abyssobacteria bacterium (strain SURF_5) TaxID=2093360 RepID=A0A3A4NGA8_ABYX5|nr:MAG: nucleotide pyrophosphatase [Candidatus Abyssubacteria bacterium SURF_5]
MPNPAAAYIGPGAGFAFLSSFFVIFLTFLLAFLSILLWPIRYLLASFRRQKAFGKSRADRVIIVGLDGLDPNLVEKFIIEGKLPNFAKLRQDGTYSRLGTTCPAISPVAWSSFMTGSNPGRHNIFDFLSRDKKTYLPDLSSAHIGKPKRTLSIGSYVIPLGKPEIKLLRKSKPFWTILGEHGIFSSVIRVPITFPPEKFKGVMLSAMCVPDLKGTQGSFTHYTTRQAEGRYTGGMEILMEKNGKSFRSYFSGPENTLRKDASEMKMPFDLVPLGPDTAELRFDGQKTVLKKGEYSDWVRLSFRAAPGMKVHGICRLLLKEIEPHCDMYMTPINIDPAKPALPISHPFIYSIYLSKLFGSYATLGLAEDTWAINERIIEEKAFRQQCYLIQEERERMFFDTLEKTKRGLCTCVFDITDRIQHLFWRYLDDRHPANRDKDVVEYKDSIGRLYADMDALVGRVTERLTDRDVLIIMSDHGFNSFRRGINLNSWLYLNGYLRLKEGETAGEWFKGVDWTKTKAFALGLGGLYLNVKGRESKGIVEASEEAENLKRELIERLTGLRDDSTGEIGITSVYDSASVYSGPYKENAPDLIIGYNKGYRASWDNATGTVTETVFSDNTKSWSGDHCIDPAHVPGVFFSNRKMRKDDINIIDVAPTALELFGIPVPPYMDGKSLLEKIENEADVPAEKQEAAV